MSILIKNQDMPKEGEKYLLEIRRDGTVYDFIGHRAAVIATQFDESASPWHRVEDDLPRYGDWVLCLGPKGGYYVSEFRGVSGLVGPRFHANGRYINATHWMPLPEPPEEGRRCQFEK